tara:strand:- start:568 stop:831 length:264 start_codon:yes stop_codon:yes gene_type:complete
MLGSMMSGLVDTEKLTYDTIQTSLEEISIDLRCSWKEFFVMIKPTDSEFGFKFYLYQNQEGKGPKYIREISLKEILGKEDEKSSESD